MRAVRIAVLVAVAGCSRDAPPSPEASRPKPKLEGRIGTEHPVIIEGASAVGGWVAYCQARRDTDGNGRIETSPPGCFGERYGDELSPYLSLAPGQEEPIDAFVAAHPSGRYLAFIQQGRLWLVDARTDERRRLDLTSLGARSADDDVTLSPPGIVFDPAAERLLFIRARAGTRAVGLMDLATGSSREIYTTTNYISRAEFDGDRVIVYVVDTDTDGNGVLYSARRSPQFAVGACRWSSPASLVGDEPTAVPIEVGTARPVEPEVQDRLPPRTVEGRRYAVSFAGGARLVASSTVAFGGKVGPLFWADADSDRRCAEKVHYSGDFDCGKSAVAPFCERIDLWHSTRMWALDRNRVWAGRKRLDLSNPPDDARDVWAHGSDGVSGTSDDDVWVVQHFDRASHWNGVAWQEHESPLLDKAVGIVAAPGGRAWVYRKDGGVVGWDGRRWHELPQPTESRITDAQLVGDQLWVATVSGQVLRYDDPHWHSTDGLPGASILAMWLSSPSRGYATTGEGEVWTWDGARWRRFERLVSPERRFAEYLLDVRAAAPDDVWVSSSRGRLFHWDGSEWTTHDSTLDYWDLEILGVWDDQVLLTHGSTVVQFRRDP